MRLSIIWFRHNSWRRVTSEQMRDLKKTGCILPGEKITVSLEGKNDVRPATRSMAFRRS